MDFNVRLKHLRQKYKLTQGELADILGIKSTAISNYESKRNEPSFEKLIALSEYFDVSCDYLLGISDAYLPIGGEVLDKDIVDFFQLYQRLNKENSLEIKNYVRYLLYKQDKLINK
jgi:transcriptional regulator with XRE-family HTH domain